MKILQYKLSNLAQAPDEISKAINMYTDHQSEVSNKIDKNYDLVHFHNKYIITGIPSLIQYHSEPEKVMLDFPNTKTVIAQYHALLPEYNKCNYIVKNIINYENNFVYNYKEITDKIKIAYSPSVTQKMTDWYDKGYEQTILILKRLKLKYPNKFDFDIITGISLEECLRRKSKCNIVIDECVTTSYHRSALEGVCMGKMTICSIGDELQKLFAKITGSYYLPFENITIDNLEYYLENLVNNNKIDYINEIGYLNWEWSRLYWNPENIIKEYTNIYNKILKEK